MTKIKICGITNVDDARCAIENGADYVGLIFAPSRRCVIKGNAKMIVDEHKDFTGWVGVFLNGKKKEIEELLQGLPIKILQFHGDESPAFCNYFINRGYAVIKTVPVKGSSLGLDPRDYDKVPYFLFDSVVNGQTGGTGMPFSWSVIDTLNLREFVPKIILSGGLAPDNVSAAIKQVAPYAVDASSRLEKEPGLKDHKLIKDFITAARSV
jgi:phosphoribosylanthranilate isomerase